MRIRDLKVREVVNYPDIKVKLLIALRGEKSSAELSRDMGFSFNQVRRWEQGQKQLRWDEFCDYCAVLGIPLAETVNRINLLQPNLQSLEELKKNMIRDLRARFHYLTLEALSKQLNCHISVLKRYLKGQTSPDLEFVFAMLDLKENWLANFVTGLLPENMKSSLNSLFEIKETAAISEAQMPLACAIENTLALECYRQLAVHDENVIAERVGCSPLEVKIILNRMLAAGTVAMNDQGKYEITYNTINTDGVSDKKAVSQMLRFWSERAAQRFTDEGIYSHTETRGAISYRVAPMSKASMLKVNEIIRRAGDEILNVLEAGEGPYEDVRVVLLHTFSVGDVPRAEIQKSVNPSQEPGKTF